MATDMYDCMTQTMDSVTKGFEASLDAGRKAQAAWFDAFSGFKSNQPGFDHVLEGPGQFVGAWMPLWSSNAKATVDCFDANMKKTLGFVRTACEATFDAGNNDGADAAKTVCDAAFETAKSNFTTLSNATRSGFDRWTSFVKCASENGHATKGAAKSSK